MNHCTKFSALIRCVTIKTIRNQTNIADMRIHVERVIGLVRQKYTVLQNTIPTVNRRHGEDTTVIVYIVHISCALKESGLSQAIIDLFTGP